MTVLKGGGTLLLEWRHWT